MENLQQVLQAVHDETITRNEKLMETHKRDALAHQELSLSLHSSLESLLQRDVARFSEGMVGFDALLVSFPYFPKSPSK